MQNGQLVEAMTLASQARERLHDAITAVNETQSEIDSIANVAMELAHDIAVTEICDMDDEDAESVYERIFDITERLRLLKSFHV